jgi:hypothetical protein
MDGVAATPLIRIWEAIGSKLGRDTVQPDWEFRLLPHSLQANARIAHELGHNNFLKIF